MKPFGVRLAAGAVTILLGAIMAAQAQKDHQQELNNSWDPTIKSETSTPAPIGGQWADAESQQAPDPNPFPDVPNAIQLVQHVEPDVPVSTDTFVIPSDLSMGDIGPSADTTVADAPAAQMDLPPSMPANRESANEAATVMDLPPLPDLATAPHSNGLPHQQENPPAARPEVNQLAANGPSNDLRSPSFDQSPNMDPAIEAALRAQPGPDGRFENPQPMLRNVAPVETATPQQIAMEEQRRRDAIAMQYAEEQRLARQQQDAQLRYEEQLQLQQQQERQRQELERQAAQQRFQQPATPMRQDQPLAPQLNNTFNNNMMTVPRTGIPARMASAPLGNALRNDQGLRALPAGQSPASGQPGDRRLEGAQAPSVVIHKRAPAEVKVGKPATFVVQVQNVGSVEALNVKIHDQIPAGMAFRDATPKPQAVGNTGAYVWNLGNLAAGEERTVTMELVPQAEGELGSVARVTFEAAASVRTNSTRPEIKIVQKGPPTVLVGQQLEIEVEVSNPGTGTATGVILQEDVPDGLEHPQGRQLDNLIGTLRPGEVRRQVLRLRAVSPGAIRNMINLKADDGLVASHSIDVEVVSPNLKVALTGPSRRYLERQAEFKLEVFNGGTAPAEDVRIAAYLDRGFTFVSTGNQGQYDEGRHAVFWRLDRLPAGGIGSIPLKLLPVQEGSRAIQLEAKSTLGNVAKNEHIVNVESQAELVFSINDTADPIEVGTETTYQIKVTNNGSRPDQNVKVQLQFPPGIEVQSTDVDAQQVANGLISFSPRASLSANGEMTYTIKARGRQQGTHLIKAMVVSDQSRVPVTKEESTMVYDDQGPVAARPVGFRR